MTYSSKLWLKQWFSWFWRHWPIFYLFSHKVGMKYWSLHESKNNSLANPFGARLKIFLGSQNERKHEIGKNLDVEIIVFLPWQSSGKSSERSVKLFSSFHQEMNPTKKGRFFLQIKAFLWKALMHVFSYQYLVY